MVQYLQLERVVAGSINAGAAVIFDNPVSTGGDKVIYDNISGEISFNKAGVYYINWFVAQQTGLATDGSNFAIYVGLPSSTDPDLIVTASNHVKVSQTSGFAIVEVAEGKEGSIARLVNVSASTATLSDVTQVKAGITVFEMTASEPAPDPKTQPMGYIQAQVAASVHINPVGLIPFDTIVNQDTNALITQDVATKHFLLKEQGVYLVTWEVPVSATNTNDFAKLSLMVNGTSHSSSLSPTPLGVNAGSAVITSEVENAHVYLRNATNDQIAIAALANITITQLSKSEEPLTEEFFKFTIDTTMTNTPDNDPTHFDGTSTTFIIPTNGFVGENNDHVYNWVIDWGDGKPAQVVSGTSSVSSLGITHEYDTPGEYQITIKSHGGCYNGWMNAFGFRDGTNGPNEQSNKNMVKSIDSPIPKLARTKGATNLFAYMFHGLRNAAEVPADLFSLVDTAGDENASKMFRYTFYEFAQNSTSATIPKELFENIDVSSATDVSQMFNSTFLRYAMYSTVGTIPEGLLDSIATPKATALSGMFTNTFLSCARSSLVGTIPPGLFNSISTSMCNDVNNMFDATFYSYASDSPVVEIPQGLFDFFDTSNVTNFSNLFIATFYYFGGKNTSLTIPPGLFSAVDTSSATDLSSMFSNTFMSLGATSSALTIPDGLFDFLETSSVTKFESMFSNTFDSCGAESSLATIPPGLFDSLDTTNGETMDSMFSTTFSHFGKSNPTASIPPGLFDSINTSKAIEMEHMFDSTFSYFGASNTSATIPNDLFDFLDMSSATNVSRIMFSTFNSFAESNTTPTTDINDIWGNANFAGKITSAIARFAFMSTFYNMESLTGTAQTFIDGKLDGVIPNGSTQAFRGTSVTDLATLDANWK